MIRRVATCDTRCVNAHAYRKKCLFLVPKMARKQARCGIDGRNKKWNKKRLFRKAG